MLLWIQIINIPMNFIWNYVYMLTFRMVMWENMRLYLLCSNTKYFLERKIIKKLICNIFKLAHTWMKWNSVPWHTHPWAELLLYLNTKWTKHHFYDCPTKMCASWLMPENLCLFLFMYDLCNNAVSITD